MSCEGYYLECQCDECINRETPFSAKDARIAELTEGHRSLVDEVAKQVLRVTQLTAEVSRYKAALEGIVGLNGGHRSETNSLLNDTQTIARNALKEGV